MRKDVKFGLTIGGILIATLVVYCIVITRSSQRTERVAALPAEVPTAPGDADRPAADKQTTDADAAANSSATPGSANSEPAPTDQPQPDIAPGVKSESIPAPANAASGSNTDSSPTTLPSAVASSAVRNDWNAALEHGLIPLAAPSEAQPPRTFAPEIDRPASPADAGVIETSAMPASDARPPSIDSAAAQPHALVANPMPMPGPSSPRADGSIAGGSSTHVIQPGENLWVITVAAYGNARYLNKVLAANPGLDPKHLHVGKTIVLPALSDAERAAAPRRALGAGNDRPVTIDPAHTYVVRPGDTLEKISRKLYGDGSMKEKIYDANRALIGANEDRIKVGMALKLPEPPTAGATASR